MAASLRSGLSFGLSGFTYWSHDAGGFVMKAPQELYRRWFAFAALTSHTRCHGAPPREPWEYDEEFMDSFRRTIELKYKLMPYIYGQAVDSSANGYPMLRALFLEFPEDPGSWLVEDQYLLGADLLVAPLFDEAAERVVYLPPGKWFNYQTGKVYAGGGWNTIKTGPVPIVLMVRDHSVIPHIALAQSTADMDWSKVELRTFSSDGKAAEGLFAKPNGVARKLTVEFDQGAPALHGKIEDGTIEASVTSF